VRHIIPLFVDCLSVPYFYTLSHKRHISGKHWTQNVYFHFLYDICPINFWTTVCKYTGNRPAKYTVVLQWYTKSCFSSPPQCVATIAAVPEIIRGVLTCSRVPVFPRFPFIAPCCVCVMFIVPCYLCSYVLLLLCLAIWRVRLQILRYRVQDCLQPGGGDYVSLLLPSRPTSSGPVVLSSAS
jgi:hypothetical protein